MERGNIQRTQTWGEAGLGIYLYSLSIWFLDEVLSGDVDQNWIAGLESLEEA